MKSKIWTGLVIAVQVGTMLMLTLMALTIWDAGKHHEAARCYRAGGGAECAATNSRAVRIADRIIDAVI